jgi:hypothetical protein
LGEEGSHKKITAPSAGSLTPLTGPLISLLIFLMPASPSRCSGVKAPATKRFWALFMTPSAMRYGPLRPTTPPASMATYFGSATAPA